MPGPQLTRPTKPLCESVVLMGPVIKSPQFWVSTAPSAGRGPSFFRSSQAAIHFCSKGRGLDHTHRMALLVVTPLSDLVRRRIQRLYDGFMLIRPHPYTNMLPKAIEVVVDVRENKRLGRYKHLASHGLRCFITLNDGGGPSGLHVYYSLRLPVYPLVPVF